MARKFITAMCDACKDLLWKEPNRERAKAITTKHTEVAKETKSAPLWTFVSFVV
jgi:hypothetical protein